MRLFLWLALVAIIIALFLLAGTGSGMLFGVGGIFYFALWAAFLTADYITGGYVVGPVVFARRQPPAA